ncbi:cytochrome-c oxidase [Neisseria chenwenguii]|uniref:Cytochrome-c oxidase n=1 Tax=Neisseria chenwenguii TaxID=1853278 RepID=A0A220S219_9NEIS|nr:cytochrome-c oxidase [Neisseria chenwenguii]ASK27529.1 cytochrome-c oxidase [Neisseria chenwenguii]ROV55607.1 cytochrome-c oxidase [Neisseria chenwenguii]
MGLSDDDKKVDVRKIKPQPYESFEETEARREQEATEVNAPLTEEQKRIVREQADINPVAQTVNDVLKDDTQKAK